MKRSHQPGRVAALLAGIALSCCTTSTAGPHKVYVDLPTSDRYYRAIVNAVIGIDKYLNNMSPDDRLITDLTGHVTPGNSDLDTPQKVEEAYNHTLRLMMASHPDIIIGTYHSSRDVETESFSHPPRAVSQVPFSGSQLSDYYPPPTSPHYGRSYVDYTQRAARARLIQSIVIDVIHSGRPVVLLDNVSHSCHGWPIPWSTTMLYLHELAERLHEHSIRAIANVAWAIGNPGCGDASAEQYLATGMDGLTLEMPLHNSVRTNPQHIELAIRQYRTLLDAGRTVVLLPISTDTERAHDARTLAAFGLMFRKPGDRLFIGWPFFSPEQDWFHWPADLGKPQGSALVLKQPDGEILIRRTFERTVLELNLSREVIRMYNR